MHPLVAHRSCERAIGLTLRRIVGEWDWQPEAIA
jgi:hypothetical protein